MAIIKIKTPEVTFSVLVPKCLATRQAMELVTETDGEIVEINY